MKIYMKVSKDKYRLPEAVSDSVKELAEMCGESPRVISSLASKASKGKHKNSPYIRIEIEEGEEDDRERQT